MKHFIAIAGNIGAGKTCLSKRLAALLGWELYQEPFQENPYLENFYGDMTKWAFQCEMAFLGHRLNNHWEILNKENSTIQDRCIYEGAEIFVKNLYRNNHLSETDWNTYNNLYQTIISNLRPPELIVYLKSSPERCLSNIKTRNRAMDTNIDESYLRNLSALYDEWHNNFSACPVMMIESDGKDFKDALTVNQIAKNICETLAI
jgi:deoxyadenosine/deoxycytidine kinase